MARPHGTFAWYELLSSDVAASQDFFARTLGWTFDDFSLEGHPYWVIRSGADMVGGLGPLEHGDVETTGSYWIGFIEVTDIDDRFAAAIEAGAEIIRPPHDVASIGRVCVLRDPTGAFIGWMQSADPN